MKGEIVLATFLLGIVVSFVERSKPGQEPRKWSCLVGPVFWILALYLAATSLVEVPNYLDFPVIASIAAVFVTWLRPGIVAGPVLLGASAAAAHEWSVASEPMARVSWVWLLAGAVAALGLVGGQRASVVAFGIAAAFASGVNAWTPDSLLKVSHQYGTFLAVIAAFAWLVSSMLEKEGARPIARWVSLIALPAGAFALAQWGGHATNPTILVTMATLFAAVSAYMFGETPPPWRLFLAGLGWTAIATFAYSDQRAFGLALACSAGALAYLLIGQPSRVATMAPLVALAFYRTFRAGHPETVKAFDIGQHYALVGLIIALGTVALLAQFGTKVGSVQILTKKFTALLAAAVLVVGGSLFATVFLGDKGTVGLVIGYGLGPLFAVGSGLSGKGSVAVSLALSGAVSFGMSLLPDTSELNRDSKITMFWVAVLVAAALAALAAWAVSENKEPQSAQA